jgi:hypothetical protein
MEHGKAITLLLIFDDFAYEPRIRCKIQVMGKFLRVDCVCSAAGRANRSHLARKFLISDFSDFVAANSTEKAALQQVEASRLSVLERYSHSSNWCREWTTKKSNQIHFNKTAAEEVRHDTKNLMGLFTLDNLNRDAGAVTQAKLYAVAKQVITASRSGDSAEPTGALLSRDENMAGRWALHLLSIALPPSQLQMTLNPNVAGAPPVQVGNDTLSFLKAKQEISQHRQRWAVITTTGKVPKQRAPSKQQRRAAIFRRETLLGNPHLNKDTFVLQENTTITCGICRSTPIRYGNSQSTGPESWAECHARADTRGGSHEISNLFTGCSTCNQTMKTLNMVIHINNTIHHPVHQAKLMDMFFHAGGETHVVGEVYARDYAPLAQQPLDGFYTIVTVDDSEERSPGTSAGKRSRPETTDSKTDTTQPEHNVAAAGGPAPKRQSTETTAPTAPSMHMAQTPTSAGALHECMCCKEALPGTVELAPDFFKMQATGKIGFCLVCDATAKVCSDSRTTGRCELAIAKNQKKVGNECVRIASQCVHDPRAAERVAQHAVWVADGHECKLKSVASMRAQQALFLSTAQ